MSAAPESGGPPPPGSGGGPPPPPPPGSGGPPPPPPPPPGSGPPPGYAPPQFGYSTPPPGYQQPYGSGQLASVMQPGVPPPDRLAGYGPRFLAGLLDGLISLVLIITIIGPWLYPIFTMMRQGANNGQTFGKQALGIRVVREDGRPWEAGTAAVREIVIKQLLFGTAGAFFLFIPTLADYLWPLWDERNQALHDKIAGSYVVKA